MKNLTQTGEYCPRKIGLKCKGTFSLANESRCIDCPKLTQVELWLIRNNIEGVALNE